MIQKNKTLMSLPERLRYIRELLGLTRADIKKRHNISADTLSAWELGKISISEQGIDKCIQAYKKEGLLVSQDWLVSGSGVDPRFVMDLAKYVQASNEVYGAEEKSDDHLNIIKEIDFFKSLSGRSVVITLTSDDMFPVYNLGDIVAGRYKRKFDLNDFLSKDCIVKTVNHEVLFRRVVRVTPEGLCNLSCLNTSMGGAADPVLYNVKVVDIAPVIWHRRLDS